MYIAMNRFTVPTANAADFEALWLNRESKLAELPGFVAFHMLKGPQAEDGTILYASHTVWADEADFLNWTRSQQFRTAHASSAGQGRDKPAGTEAGERRKLHEGAPRFEGFTVIQEINAPA